MAPDALRDELLTLPGVAAVEVDLGDDERPAGVRVRLEANADASRVGTEVQRVLTSHGMPSRFADGAPDTTAGTSAPAEPPAASPSATSRPLDRSSGPSGPAVEARPSTTTTSDRSSSTPMAPVSELRPDAPTRRVADAALEAVAMEERADGLAVRVTLDDGRSGTQDLVIDEPDVVDAAVLAAVAAALGVEFDVVATEWLEVDGSSIVTVALRLSDGALVAGAGVVRVGRAFAVGNAAMAALDL